MQSTRALIALLALTIVSSSNSEAQELAYLLGDEATSSDDFGYSVANVDDINFDGHPDILVGAPFDDVNGAASGSVYIYSGKTGALLWTASGEFPGDLFGRSVDGIGDLNGDGASEIIVGAPLYDNNGAGVSGGGKVYVLAPAQDATLFSLWSNSLNTQVGSVVRGLGDITGDGISDFALGAPSFDNGGLIDCGAVFAFSGSDLSNLWVRFGDEFGENLGYSLDTLHESNAVQSRILIGSPRFDAGGSDRGRILILNGLGSTISTVNGTTNDTWFGYAVAGIGDANGDGANDYAVSMPYADILGVGLDAGLVRMYSGFNGNLLFTFTGPHASARLGQALSGFGDFNGDGRKDLLIGSPNLHGAGNNEAGEVRVISGANGLVLATYSATPNDHAGRSVSSAGDLNLDGVGDFVFGIPDGPSQEGQAQVHISQAPFASTYCSAKVNSQGCLPAISYEGLPSASIANNFRVKASNVINQKIGLLLWGRGPLNLPFFGGTLCVGAPQRRTTPQSSAGSLGAPDCSGEYSFHFSQAYMVAESILPGDQIYAQYWSRDTADAFGVGLTDALSFRVVP